VPQLIVLHFTAMANASAALARLCEPEHEVSAHYLIGRDGAVYQLVDEAQRAWHAGAGTWAGGGDVNSRSVGIELDNCGQSPFSAPQMDALEPLLKGIMARWNIPAKGVIGHSDMAPVRKGDPGRRFDWRRLAKSNVSVWPCAVAPSQWPCAPQEGAFLDAARRFGYDPACGGATLLAAFRQRFRPHATGPLNGADLAAIENLAQRFPIDPCLPNA